jgi:hypothetical protein
MFYIIRLGSIGYSKRQVTKALFFLVKKFGKMCMFDLSLKFDVEHDP